LQEISTVFPEARVIHVIRDGRDVAVSRMHHIWNRERPVEEGGDLKPEDRDKRDRYRKEGPEDFLASGESIFTEQRIKGSAEVWNTNVTAAHRDGPAMLGDRYIEVRYEDLLERPEEEARRLFEFLGAGGDEEVLRRCVEATDFEALSGRKRGNEAYEMGFQKRRKGIAGDWKNVFTERDKAIYKETAGDLLIKLRYAEDDSW